MSQAIRPVAPPTSESGREGVGIAVVGSIHLDRTSYVPRLPRAGETVMASSSVSLIGGKGANQARAAAKLGARVTMVGAVGADDEGTEALHMLGQTGVDTQNVNRVVEAATGSAFIAVDELGENFIVVDSGANKCVAVDVVTDLLSRRRPGSLVLSQGELRAPVVEATALVAQQRGLRFVLNLAPYQPLPAAVLAEADPLVVNEVEARELLGETSHEPDYVGTDLATRLIGAYGRSVVVTLGAAGAAVCSPEGAWHEPAVKVPQVVDTTGAGDAFIGALVALIAQGHGLRHAVQVANVAGAITVGRRGVDASPTSEELEHYPVFEAYTLEAQ